MYIFTSWHYLILDLFFLHGMLCMVLYLTLQKMAVVQSIDSCASVSFLIVWTIGLKRVFENSWMRLLTFHFVRQAHFYNELFRLLVFSLWIIKLYPQIKKKETIKVSANDWCWSMWLLNNDGFDTTHKGVLKLIIKKQKEPVMNRITAWEAGK